MPRRDLSQARVLITGASGGIGAAVAKALAFRGARLVLFARNAERLAAAAESAVESGAAAAIAVAGDVASPTDRAAALQACVDQFGGLDVLVNNAGVGAVAPFAELPAEAFDRVIEVDLLAPIRLVREALPLLTEAASGPIRPVVVQVGSILAHRAIPNYTAYCASKFGLHGFSQALRPELAEQGIDLLEIDPGPTESEFHSNVEYSTRAPSGGLGRTSAEAVAAATARALERGARRIVPSFTGRLMLLANRWCPAVVDWFVSRPHGR